MDIKRTVLLTGASGFLGSALLASLLREQYKVVIVKRSDSNLWRIKDLVPLVSVYDADLCNLDLIFKDHQIDIVVHTACNYGRNNDSLTEIVESNLMFGLHIFELCRKAGTKMFVNTDSLLPSEINEYSLSKRQFVDWLKFYSQKIKVVNFKLDHMYGPKDDNSKFIVWLIEQMMSDVFEIKLTKGEQLRDFIYIDDVVSAYIKILENIDFLKGFNEFEVGTGEAVSIKHFVTELHGVYEDIFGKINTKLSFGSVPYRKDEIMSVNVNSSSLIRMGWLPKIKLRTGLKNILEGYR